jgi:opacity protein-like surface antigen
MTLTGKIFIAAAALAAFSGSAMAADLYVPPAAEPAPIPAASTWDGPYVGASLGYGWQGLSGAASGSGWLIGVQAGYNAHLSDAIVGGLEANVDWNNGNSADYGIFWDGSVRARLGIDAGSVLPYAELGVAFANVGQWAPAANATVGTRTGWTAGAGVEFWLADSLSANVEYRYTDYGSGSGGTDLTDNSIRVGLNYHF